MKSTVLKKQSQILKMPGVHCALYAAGHCLYDERLNPQYESGWRCTELLRYMELYDTLVDQADRFTLSNSEMVALWNKRIAATPPPGECCPSYAPRHTGCPGCSKSAGACSAGGGAGDASAEPNAKGGKTADQKLCSDADSSADESADENDADVLSGAHQDDVRREMGIDFSSALGCLFAMDSACVLRMPVCDGVCGRFERRNG